MNLHPRTRLTVEQTLIGALALVLLPVALPVLGGVVLWYRWHRPGQPRPASWWWRVWWWYGYECGLYRLDWWLKKRRA